MAPNYEQQKPEKEIPKGEPVRVGEIQPGILDALKRAEIIDVDPGRTLGARLTNERQLAEFLIQQIEEAKANGQPTIDLEEELRQANFRLNSLSQGFMPEQDTRPQ